jgi:hypothetical protein
MSQPESRLSRAIIAAIKAGGGYAVKFHGGPMTEAGTPDIMACIPVECGHGDNCEPLGLFVGIETKMPDKRGNVSPIQQRRHEQIRAVYGKAIVVTSVQEAVAALESFGWIRRTDPDA